MQFLPANEPVIQAAPNTDTRPDMTIVTNLTKLAQLRELDKFLKEKPKSAVIVHNGQNFVIGRSSGGWIVASKGHTDSEMKDFNAALLKFRNETPYTYHLLSRNGYGSTWVDSMVAKFTRTTISAAAEKRMHGKSWLYSAANALERHSLGVSSTSFAEQRAHKFGLKEGWDAHNAMAQFRQVVRGFRTPDFNELDDTVRLVRLADYVWRIDKEPLQKAMNAVKANFFAGKPDADRLIKLLADAAIMEVAQEDC
jgi:hypothetical protein